MAMLQQYGWKKVLRKHVNGRLTDSEIQGFNSFFPTGKKIEIEYQGTVHTRKLPDVMSNAEVKSFIAKTLNKGDRTGSGTGERTELSYKLTTSERNKYGIKEMIVSISPSNDVVTAHPKKGSNIHVWNGDDGKFGEYDGDGNLLLEIIRVLRRALVGEQHD